MSELPPSAAYLAVGASHRTSSARLRGRILVEDASLPRLLGALKETAEAVVLSGPERIEVFAASADPAKALTAIKQALAREAGTAAADIENQLFALRGEDAVRHVFAVAAGLDSLVAGDPDIARRLRAARDLARSQGAMGAKLEALIEAALQAAARIAAETGIGGRPASIAAAALTVARDVHGDLSRAGALLIGTGEMGERLAREFLAAGLARLTVTGKSATRVEQAARRLNCEAVPLEVLDEALPAADIVIAALSSHPPAVSAAMVKEALKRRRQKPVLLIDAAIPGDIAREAGDLEEAFRYDLNDLEHVVMAAGAERAEVARAASDIAAREASRFAAGGAGRETDAAIALFRSRFEDVRGRVLKEEGGDAVSATRKLIERLLPEAAAIIQDLLRPGAKPKDKDK